MGEIVTTVHQAGNAEITELVEHDKSPGGPSRADDQARAGRMVPQ